MPSSVTVTLNFGQGKHCLWNTAIANFIQEEPERFVLLEGEECHTGTMYFCDRYLEAQFIMALEDGVALYFDKQAGGNERYVVVSNQL